jgi:hypothetical protein
MGIGVLGLHCNLSLYNKYILLFLNSISSSELIPIIRNWEWFTALINFSLQTAGLKKFSSRRFLLTKKTVTEFRDRLIDCRVM